MYHNILKKKDLVEDNFVESNGRFNFKLAFRVVKVLETIKKHPINPDFIKFYGEKFLMPVLLIYGCDDEDVVLRIFQFYDRYLETVWYSLSKEYEEDIVDQESRPGPLWKREWHSRFSPEAKRCDYIVAPLFVRTFQSFRGIDWEKGQKFLAFFENRVLHACDLPYLVALVRYGKWTSSMDKVQKCNLAWDFEEIWVNIQRHIPRNYGMQFRRVLFEGRRLWYRLQENRGKMLSASARGFQRVLLAVRTLKAVLLRIEKHPTEERYVQCLKVYFTTLTDPFVSAGEVRELLTYLMRGEGSREAVDAQAVDQMVDVWIDLFGRQPYTPRSLAHLCRVKVRDVLLENRSSVLPNLVKQLDIPLTLKDFLLGAPE